MSTLVMKHYKISTLYQATFFLILILFTLNISANETSGKTKIKIQGERADNIGKRISIQQIEALGITEIKAYNPYEKKTDLYTGVWVDKFVQRFAKPEIKQMTLTAIDNYKIDYYPQEWNNIRILMATRVNGKYIGYAKKGPMRIVFPEYDASKKIYQDTMPK